MTEQRKTQVVFIHGGDAFRDRDKFYAMLRSRSFNPYEVKQKWRDELIKNIADTHECHALSMPNAFWADYEAWKIWFEKMVPYMRDGVVLVGHSLGGAFLFRYMSEAVLPVSIAQLHLIAPVILPLEDCEGFYTDIEHWSGFRSVPKSVHLWHSEDDTIVPIAHSETLTRLYPGAQLHRFTDRFHFIGESFPELEAVIKTV